MKESSEHLLCERNAVHKVMIQSTKKRPMDTFPKIETDRLILGELFVKDIPNIIAYAGNRKIAANTLNVPHPYGEKDAIFWMNSVNQGFEHKTQFSFGIRI